MDNFQNLFNLYQNLPEDAAPKDIKRTAGILKDKHYSPILIYPVKNFSLMTKADMMEEYTFALNGGHTLSDTEMLMYHLKLLLYHYQILCRLRKDEPEAWDIINELYEDD